MNLLMRGFGELGRWGGELEVTIVFLDISEVSKAFGKVCMMVSSSK